MGNRRSERRISLCCKMRMLWIICHDHTETRRGFRPRLRCVLCNVNDSRTDGQHLWYGAGSQRLHGPSVIYLCYPYSRAQESAQNRTPTASAYRVWPFHLPGTGPYIRALARGASGASRVQPSLASRPDRRLERSGAPGSTRASEFVIYMCCICIHIYIYIYICI